MNGIKTTLGSFRDMITKYLGKAILNNPQFKIDFQGIKYSVTFGHFGLRVDPKSTGSVKQPNSVVIDLEVEVKQLNASTNEIIINDLKNEELLGEMGVKSLSLETLSSALDAKTKRPLTLKFRVPLEVSIDAKEGLLVKALSVDTNIQLLNIGWDYVSPLLLPDYVVSRKDPITGKLIEITESTYAYSTFEEQLKAQKEQLAKALQVYLQSYLKESGATMINQVLQENHFTSIIEDMNKMDPLSAPVNQHAQSILWGVIPTELKYDATGVTFGLNAFAEDPAAAKSVALPSVGNATGPTELGSFNGSYDVALSVNETFVNRLMQLSFDRGYYTNMNIEGDAITLVTAPYFYVDSSLTTRDVVKLHISMNYVYQPETKMEKVQAYLAVHNPVHVDFDIMVKIKCNGATGSLALVKQNIDLNSVQLDKASVTTSLFYNKVLAAVKAKLSITNAQWAKKESLLADAVTIPNELVGIPMHILPDGVQTDSNGHFNVFAELK